MDSFDAGSILEEFLLFFYYYFIFILFLFIIFLFYVILFDLFFQQVGIDFQEQNVCMTV